MAKIEGFEGSYAPKLRNKQPTGKYIVKFCTGWNPERGAYGEVKRSVNSEAEAKALIASVTNFIQIEGGDKSDIPAFLDRGEKRVKRVSHTLNDVFSEFLDDRRKDKDLQKRTVDNNETHINRARPFFGDKDIRDVSPEDIKEFLQALRDDKNPLNRGKVASGTYAQKIYLSLKQVWDFAIDKNYVSTNVVTDPIVKKPQVDTEEKEPLSLDEIHSIMSTLLDHDMDSHEIGLFLLMVTGARLSEMLALRWCDLNEDKGTITIKHSLERDTQTLKSTKTKESREIPLMPSAQSVLANWKKRQQRLFKTNGVRWSVDHPICHSAAFNHFESSCYQRWWRKYRDQYNVPLTATLHTFRHTLATLLIVYCGVDTSTAQSITGHSNPDVLLKIYTHTHLSAKAEAMSSAERFMFPLSGDQTCCAHCSHWTASPEGASTCGVCWARASKTAKVFEGNHHCEIGEFERRAVA